MIALRDGLERGLGHRWLGPVLLLVLVVLLAFVAMHAALDELLASGLMCLGAALLVGVGLAVPRLAPVRRAGAAPLRGPPARAARRCAALPLLPSPGLPLRL